jgi:MFS family permease
VASSSNMLIVGRAVAGMGAAGLFSGALNIVSHSIPLRLRPGMLPFLLTRIC